ncbi:ABC transporter ATP-binding protein [Thorsellia kenyensis]|uniref:ABC-type dipeptide transporter n=1 Tax=Thorsellia kenyensis TaxID=1549888 RepID=A0ABV6C843_9GAMM
MENRINNDVKDNKLNTFNLVSISNLSIGINRIKSTYKSSHSSSLILDNVSMNIGKEIVCLIGESGSGKSTLAKVLIGILNPALSVYNGQIEYFSSPEDHAVNLLQENVISQLRGKTISMIMQEPKYALNPSLNLLTQLDYAYLGSLTGKNKLLYYYQLLDDIGLSHEILHVKPHKLSGGMGQRFMIALALLNKPQLIIADEPTSALDYDLKYQILELIVNRCKKNDIGLLLISHDLPSVKKYADRIYIMKSGSIVDSGDANLLVKSQNHYTKLLWACKPSSQTYQKSLPTSLDTL